MYHFVRSLLRTFGAVLGAKLYEEFNLTRSVEELYLEGISLRASGILFSGKESPVGVYVVRYVPSIKENKYGRYN
jgi:hypothetical protein